MKLILTRHGETEENKQGILQGHMHGTLSPLGIVQAQRVAKRLHDQSIDKIYSSDLARSLNTAKEIAQYHNHVPFIVTDEARERHFGEFQGKNKKDYGWDPKRPKATELRPKYGESLEDLCMRASGFFDKILRENRGDTVLVVGHSGFNKALIAAAVGESIEKVSGQDNTAISIFQFDEDGGCTQVIHNCVEHLNDVDNIN